MYLAENLRKYRLIKNLTQEDVAEYLGITPQSVSKWERGETFPDITFLPPLANIFETSVDMLMGMDTIRAEETKYRIHDKANTFMKTERLEDAEKVYREAFRTYPNDAEMILGLASVLALKGDTDQAVKLTEKGLLLSKNEKQNATMRAALCYLYLQNGQSEKAVESARRLPHTRESREVIFPVITSNPSEAEILESIRFIITGEPK